jgi:hypothetical protein
MIANASGVRKSSCGFIARTASRASTAVIKPLGINNVATCRSQSVVPRQTTRLICTAINRATNSTATIPSDARNSLCNPLKSTLRAVHPVQHRPESNSCDQQNDHIGNARPLRKPIGDECQNQQRAQEPPKSCEAGGHKQLALSSLRCLLISGRLRQCETASRDRLPCRASRAPAN